MKKILILLAVALVCTLASCKSDTAKLTDNFKEATEQIKATKGDTAKINKISRELNQKNKDITADMSEEDRLKLLQDPELKAAFSDYMEAITETLALQLKKDLEQLQ